MAKPGELVAGRYRVERLLGRGGMGSVHVATDEKFGVQVALKLAAASGAAHDEFLARFAREARIGNRLGRDPGFVRATDWGRLEDGVSLYLAMDLVEDARPLDLESGVLSARLERLLTAARLVAGAHRQGVIHRDLKPANVLQAGDGSIHITDFGLAKMIGEEEEREAAPSLTQTGVGMGTPSYMAPEQFDDAKGVDAKADVYALGVMLFEVLTGGGKPYGTRDVRRLWREQDKVRTGQSPLPRVRAVAPDAPEALDVLCAKAIAVVPGERIDAEGFVHELAAALAELGPPTSAGPDTSGVVGARLGGAPDAVAPSDPPSSSAGDPPTQASPSAMLTAPPPGLDTASISPGGRGDEGVPVLPTVDDDVPVLPTVGVAPQPPTVPRAPRAPQPPKARLISELPAATRASVASAAAVSVAHGGASAAAGYGVEAQKEAAAARGGSPLRKGCCCCLVFLMLFGCCFSGLVLDLGGVQGEIESTPLRRQLGKASHFLYTDLDLDFLAELEGTTPRTTFIAPFGSVEGPEVTVRFWVEDASLDDVSVLVSWDTEPRGELPEQPPTRRISYDYRSEFEHGLRLRPGSYTVRVTARDDAGNVGLDWHRFEVTGPPRLPFQRPPGKDPFGKNPFGKNPIRRSR